MLSPGYEEKKTLTQFLQGGGREKKREARCFVWRDSRVLKVRKKNPRRPFPIRKRVLGWQSGGELMEARGEEFWVPMGGAEREESGRVWASQFQCQEEENYFF